MEFLLGGVAAMGACLITNPMDVIKTRMQLQGELQARGQYAVHYKNVLHACFAIVRADGISALQKGLVPSLWNQLLMNGVRLGAYQLAEGQGWTSDDKGDTTLARSVFFGAVAGIMGAVAGSPMFLVKTHLQSQASKEVAVGHQHNHEGLTSALRTIYVQHGITGLWRGIVGALPRTAIGSAAQLSCFSLCQEYLKETKVLSANAQINTIISSLASSVAVVAFMAPFEIVSTRLYNQGVDAYGKGLFYNGITDCFVKIWRKEGILGFYKGVGPSFFRLGPHTVLCLFFWDSLKSWHKTMIQETQL